MYEMRRTFILDVKDFIGFWRQAARAIFFKLILPYKVQILVSSKNEDRQLKKDSV